MRAPATTAMILFHRFYMRHSFLTHDRNTVATAALFLATKVEEMHKRVRQVMDAAHCVLHGGSEAAARIPAEDSSPEFVAARDVVLEAERIILYTLEFDVAIDQPYAAVTQILRRWRDASMFGSRFDKVPELAALDRAAAALAFACMTTDLPLLFTTREVAIGCLHAAYALAPASVSARLKLPASAFTALVDPRVLAHLTERLAAVLEGLAAVEAAVRAAQPHLVSLPSAVAPSLAALGPATALRYAAAFAVPGAAAVTTTATTPAVVARSTSFDDAAPSSLAAAQSRSAPCSATGDGLAQQLEAQPKMIGLAEIPTTSNPPDNGRGMVVDMLHMPTSLGFGALA